MNIPPNTPVTIIHSVYCDVSPGDKGVIVAHRRDGYAVEIEANFLVAEATPSRRVEKRTMFFAPHEVKTNA